MKYLFIIMLTLTISCIGCSGGGGKELYDTAQFEELQKNNDHAAQLYEEIIKKYPGSEYAAKAQERLHVLKSRK